MHGLSTKLNARRTLLDACIPANHVYVAQTCPMRRSALSSSQHLTPGRGFWSSQIRHTLLLLLLQGCLRHRRCLIKQKALTAGHASGAAKGYRAEQSRRACRRLMRPMAAPTKKCLASSGAPRRTSPLSAQDFSMNYIANPSPS